MWDKLHHAVLEQLGQDGLLKWSPACLDSVSALVNRGGELTEPVSTDRDKPGMKYYLLVTADGLPLAVAISGVNRHYLLLVEPILAG